MSITLSDESLRALRQLEMNEVDSTIIKANILIEQQINQIIQDYFFHPNSDISFSYNGLRQTLSI